MKFRKKPVEIEAIQFTGDNHREVMEFMHKGRITRDMVGWVSGDHDGTLKIKTLEGVMTASEGDWIIKGVRGEFYPCKPDIFSATYEAVGE